MTDIEADRAPCCHPGEDTLLRHAAGHLSAGQSLVVDVHLHGCPHCRPTIQLSEAVGGALLAALPAAELSPDALHKTLDRLDENVQVSRVPQADTEELSAGVPAPQPLRGLTLGTWRWLAPGISRRWLDVPGVAGDERVFLLKIAPGTAIPEHGHRGWEITCVLSGSLSDAGGRYGPGDLAELDTADEHRPVAGVGEECICVVASESKIRVHGLMARLMQPLIRI